MEETLSRGAGMGITKELREWAYRSMTNEVLLSNPPKHVVHGVLETLIEIADRIDAEHQKALDEFWTKINAVPVTDENMAEHGWIELPKDADGEYIHIGDVMENLREDLEPSLHHRFTVYGIHYRAYGKECALTENGYPSKLYRASETRHYHAPTVEDVLREFAMEVAGKECMTMRSGVVDKYAAKLRLAGDAE